MSNSKLNSKKGVSVEDVTMEVVSKSHSIGAARTVAQTTSAGELVLASLLNSVS